MHRPPPPDQEQRERALDPANSILVQAPAGSGKTDLLTRRFLSLLTEVEDPGQIVAITFTKAAAAEMRHRILTELENVATQADPAAPADQFSIESIARRALKHSQMLGWHLLDQPAQLRISTIDSFCRDLALQQPLLSGLGDGLGIYEQPEELYRRAARQALRQIDSADEHLRSAIESLLLWRDNNWQEMENLLIEMLQSRDRWMHDFVLEREQDWEALRERLERPFAKAIQQSLAALSRLLDQVPGSREEAQELARYTCSQGGALFRTLAELADFPSDFGADPHALEDAHQAYLCLADLLLTNDGNFRKQVDKRIGFPAERKGEKAQILHLIARLSAVPNLESSLAGVRSLPPARYTDDDWQIVRACFSLLRNAAGQLKVVFAEAGAVDYIEVAQIALNVLKGADGLPSDAAISVADGIHHILVDEFQDTSRRQHELLRRLIAAWPDREGRSCFVVGDPMQSIYFFRDADAELFPRVREAGLEIPNSEPLLFDSVGLTANFRTTASLVENLNEMFEKVFEADDGSGVKFTPARPARKDPTTPRKILELHVNFARQTTETIALADVDVCDPREAQADEIVSLISSYKDRIEECRLAREGGGNEKFRVAVLGRTRSALAPIAQALREAAIPFRSVDLEKLAARPEVLDVLALARALLNPLDRVAWLGVLRAPWCGLALNDLHVLTSADNARLLVKPVPELLGERLSLLSNDGRLAAERVLEATAAAPTIRFSQPTASLGTWLEQVWLRLGGSVCVDAAARTNLDLLWKSLDKLPNGEEDLFGSALDTALKSLTAQPDPASSSECGVQLMTIHKSKGLEFEVVIIPELQAGSGRGRSKLLSWLERGLAPGDLEDQPEDHDEITEFLVAPLQSKGADRGTTKEWVDRVYRERESHEMRRILYVAATRARDELHLFARPACKQDKTGAWMLTEPKGSLLATAWPALQTEIQQRFEEWKEAEATQEEDTSVIASIAASSESNLLVMPPPIVPTLLRRLPPDYRPAQSEELRRAGETQGVIALNADQLYQRHEGGLLSRALGTGVHSLLEQLARLRKVKDWDDSRSDIRSFEPRIAAQVRATGIDPPKAASIAADALRIAFHASDDPNGRWILSPHAEDASEARWTGLVAGRMRTVQVDRLFRAGLDPLSEGKQAWWIIDYKTSEADEGNITGQADALPQLRGVFAPQLETYAAVLRKMHGDTGPIRAGLYYPRLSQFDWWEI